MTNISEGGMAIFFRGKLPKGAVSSANFKLSGVATPLEPKVQIAWMDDSGRAGLRFTDMAKGFPRTAGSLASRQSEKRAN